MTNKIEIKKFISKDGHYLDNIEYSGPDYTYARMFVDGIRAPFAEIRIDGKVYKYSSNGYIRFKTSFKVYIAQLLLTQKLLVYKNQIDDDEMRDLFKEHVYALFSRNNRRLINIFLEKEKQGFYINKDELNYILSCSLHGDQAYEHICDMITQAESTFMRCIYCYGSSACLYLEELEVNEMNCRVSMIDWEFLPGEYIDKPFFSFNHHDDNKIAEIDLYTMHHYRARGDHHHYRFDKNGVRTMSIMIISELRSWKKEFKWQSKFLFPFATSLCLILRSQYGLRAVTLVKRILSNNIKFSTIKNYVEIDKCIQSCELCPVSEAEGLFKSILLSIKEFGCECNVCQGLQYVKCVSHNETACLCHPCCKRRVDKLEFRVTGKCECSYCSGAMFIKDVN